MINRRAAMAFVDASHENWQSLVLASKNSAATRRIPLCLVSDAGDTRAEAIVSGADLALSWADLDAQIRNIVAEFARIPDPSELARLECECQDELPPLGAEGPARIQPR